MILTALLACALLLPAGRPLAGDGPVARIGDEELSREDFGLWLVDRVGLDHAEDWVVTILARREAEERGLLPTDEEVREAHDAQVRLILKEYYHGDRSLYEKDIVLRGEDPAKHEARRLQEVRDDLTLAALAAEERVVTDEQVERRMTDLFGPLRERTTLDVVFFSMYADVPEGTRPNMTALREEALAHAEAAIAKLRNGAAFREVVATGDRVDSPFVTAEGRIDTYRRQLLGKEVEAAVAQLDEPGDLSPPISVFDGYYVIQLVGREAVEHEDAVDAVRAMLLETPPNSGELAATRQRLLDRVDVEMILD